MKNTSKIFAQLLLIIAIAIPIYNYNNCYADIIAVPIEELLKDQKQNKEFKEKQREPKPILIEEIDQKQIYKNIDKELIDKDGIEKD